MVYDDRFRTDGGATWLNLLATQGRSFGMRPQERLEDPADAHDWLSMVGLPPVDDLDDDDLAELIALREALRSLAIAAVARRPFEPGAESVVVSHASAGSAVLLSAAGRMPFRAACAVIAVQALVTLRGPDRAYLKECAEGDCRWVFLDPSGRRRWCPAPACASRGRVRAHRAAMAAKPGS